MRKITRKFKKSTKQYITVCIISFLVVASFAAGVCKIYIDGVKTKCNDELEVCYKEMSENKRTVYIANEDIKAGDIITKNNINLKYIYATQPQETYIDKKDIGKIVLVDIQKDTQVLKTMLTNNKVDDGTREVEYKDILISTNIVSNDTVDVRLVYPNGEDYVVLSKKILKGYKGDKPNCFFWLSEDEILRMASAVVDTLMYTGAYLYTDKYVEPAIQEASAISYVPSLETIKLLKTNPNILKKAADNLSDIVRKALENRLSDSMNKDVKSSNWNLRSNYIYQYQGAKEGSEEDTDTSEDNTDTSVKDKDTEEEGSNNFTDQTKDEPPVPTKVPEYNDDSRTDYPETGSQNNYNIKSNGGADLGSNTYKPDKRNSNTNSEYFSIEEG